MERSGPSIEVKVVVLVGAAVVVQDLLLLTMYLGGARPSAMQIVLGGALVLALVGAAVWGNALSRAIKRLSRACYVARHGDTGVLSDLTRMDELGQLNDEINKLIVLLRDLAAAKSELASCGEVTEAVAQAAPDLLRSAHDALVSLKELREGAAATIAIHRRLSGCLEAARTQVAQVAGATGGGRAEAETAEHRIRQAAQDAQYILSL